LELHVVTNLEDMPITFLLNSGSNEIIQRKFCWIKLCGARLRYISDEDDSLLGYYSM
jgi:hypothetical protein